MQELLTAIQEAFDGDDELRARFPNGCYLSLAPNDEALPVCVLTVISDIPDYSTCNSTVQSLSLRFAVFANTDTVALDAVSDIRAVFDEAHFALPTDVLRSEERV
jgi:hypothetical protein